MKPATEPSDSGIIETTTRRRVIPVSEQQTSKTPDTWDYLRAITPQNWANHMVYGYRIEPAPKVPIFRCSEQFVQLPNGQRVEIADKEALEFALMQNFGGGVFRLLVKSGPQIVTADNIAINAPPRPITIPVDPQTPPAPGSQSFSTDATAIASKAIDTVAGAEHQAVRIGIDALGAAANIVRSFGDGRPAPAPQDDLTRQLMAVMIQRMLQPPPDPLELLTKLLALQGQLNPAGGAAGGPLVEKLLGAAVDRFMNPAPNGAPVSASAELVRSLPQIGSQAVEGLRAFAAAREAEARIVAMQRGVQVVAQPPAAAPPATAAQILPPAVPQPATQEGAPSMEFVQKRIIEILRAPVSAEQAADDALAFLDGIDPQIVNQLAAMGAQGILAFFQQQPILKQATNNMPRLIEFVQHMLRMHAEDQAAEAAKNGQTAPVAQSNKPTLPN